MAASTVSVSQSATIAVPPAEVFAHLIDPRTVGERSRDTDGVTIDVTQPLRLGSQFRRTLYSHGLANRQVVTVIELEPPLRFATRTTLLGYSVEYHYALAPAGDRGTQLTLTKTATGGWRILRPLIAHLLTRPEHDADHLDRLCALAERPQPSESGLLDRA